MFRIPDSLFLMSKITKLLENFLKQTQIFKFSNLSKKIIISLSNIFYADFNYFNYLTLMIPERENLIRCYVTFWVKFNRTLIDQSRIKA